MPDHPPEPRLRAVGDGRPPLRLRGRAGHRRPGPPAARGPGRHRVGRSRPARPAPATTCSPSWCPRSSRRPPASSTGCAAATTTATSRPAPRCGWPRCSATPSACCRSRPTRSSTARSARRASSSRTSPTSLTRAIEELTRPVDAIKHQAKTVTVGISRSDETPAAGAAGAEVLATGVARDRLTYGSLRTLADLDPAVVEVLGFTRYRIEGRVDDERHPASVVVVDRGGLGREHPEPHRDQPRAAGHQAPGGHRAAGHRGPGPPRRPHA